MSKAPTGHPVYRIDGKDNVLLGVRIPAPLHARFSEACQREGTTMSEVVRNLITAYIETARMVG